MGLVTFLEAYYSQRLNDLESRTLTDTDVYEAKQLLKVFDDLAGEGHMKLNAYMQERFSCLTRLRSLIDKSGAAPFPKNQERLQAVSYTDPELELEGTLNDLLTLAENQETAASNAFLQDIEDYCRWIGYEEDTAYIFLLRDALLPYVYYRTRYQKNLYPWLISRRFLEDVTGIQLVDNKIRARIYETLESGRIQFADFKQYCRRQILSELNAHAELKQVLLALLGSVSERKIIVVESGYGGTFPMMLSALDDRVSFRLYTTAPFLQETYQDQIFCRKYEDIHKFERLYSHELLMRYSAFRDGGFYIQLTDDPEVKKQAFSEIKYFYG